MIEFESKEINYPYAVISDVHCHDWNQFSYINEYGINSRLQDILDGIRETVTTLKNAGGSDLIITGDLFHRRGAIVPSVFNPVCNLFREITEGGVTVHLLPGNHDLENDNSHELGNACWGLSALPNFNVYNHTTCLNGGDMIFMPWFATIDEFVAEFIKFGAGFSFANKTLFCHVGLNEVFPINMGHSLDPEFFQSRKFKNVFAGHFHQHRAFDYGDTRVYSVGALTHQTFSDIGSTAGFLIVKEDEVIQLETTAPLFVEYGWAEMNNEITGFKSIGEEFAGNFVRIKDVTLEKEEANKLRAELLACGALGVVDQSNRPKVKREGAVVEFKSGITLPENIKRYIEAKYSGVQADTIFSKAIETLNKANSK